MSQTVMKLIRENSDGSEDVLFVVGPWLPELGGPFTQDQFARLNERALEELSRATDSKGEPSG